VSLGRRHLSQLLVRCGVARTRHEAWQRFVAPLREESTKQWLPIEDAIALVRDAGGVSSLAHPPTDFEEFEALRSAGLASIEAVYPWGRSSVEAHLRETAARHGLLVTGGSDCHGPEPAHRRVGSHAISIEELERLRQFSGHAATRQPA
jgi:predicted metal-dependent phosphoesterase TrpH